MATPSILGGPPITASDLQTDFKRSVVGGAAQAYKNLIAIYVGLYNTFWNGSNTLSIAQRFAAVGTQAADLFARAAALRAFLVSQNAGLDATLPSTPAGWTITFNEDGSATVVAS